MSKLSGLLPVLWPSFRDLSLSLYAIPVQCSKISAADNLHASSFPDHEPMPSEPLLIRKICFLPSTRSKLPSNNASEPCSTSPQRAPHHQTSQAHKAGTKYILHGVIDASPALKFFPLLTSIGKGMNGIGPSKAILRQINLCQVHQPWHAGVLQASGRMRLLSEKLHVIAQVRLVDTKAIHCLEQRGGGLRWPCLSV